MKQRSLSYARSVGACRKRHDRLYVLFTLLVLWSIGLVSLGRQPSSCHTDVSIVVAVHNRAKQLLACLHTWLPVTALLPRHPRIQIVRVEGQTQWMLGRAVNLGVRSASFSRILKLDADSQLTSSFLTQHPMPVGAFYSGNWRHARNENERHLNGVLYVSKADFFAVGGYDERFGTYGWDDDDLYERLEQLGLMHGSFLMDSLVHLAHPDSLRVGAPSSGTARSFPASSQKHSNRE